MKKVLLISVNDIIQNSVIEDNIDVKLLSKTLATAQETGLQPILGKEIYSGLTEAVYQKIMSGTPLSDLYTNLITYSKPYLIAKTTADFIVVNNYKFTNKGLLKLNDNSATNLTEGDLQAVKDYYDNLISQYKSDLVEFLKDSNLIDYDNDVQITSNASGWYFGELSVSCTINDEEEGVDINNYIAPDSQYTYQELEQLRQVLLVNVNNVISATVIEDNVDVKLLSKTILTTQEIYLKPILTDDIYYQVLKGVYDFQISGTPINNIWLDLLSLVKPYLINKAVAEYIVPNNYKFTNKGLLKLNDNSATNLTEGDLQAVKDYYENIAVNYKIDIINFLKKFKLTTCYNNDEDITSDAAGWFLGVPSADCDTTCKDEGGLPSSYYLDVYTLSSIFDDGTKQATFTRTDGETYTLDLSSLSFFDTYVTGGTYNSSTGVATFTNNAGESFNVGGFFKPTDDTFVTGGTYSNGSITFNNNKGGNFIVSGLFTGQTSTDTFTTGFTFNQSTYDLTIRRNDGVNITTNIGILAGDIFVTGGTYNSSTGVATFNNNSGGSFQVSGFLTGFTDVYTTGATFDNNTKIATFTRTDGGTYNLNLSSITLFDRFTTGFTYNNNTFTITDNTGQSYTATIDVMTGLTINGSLSATTLYGDGSNLTGIQSQNIYNTDGILTGNRIVDLSGNTLSLRRSSNFNDSLLNGLDTSGNTLFEIRSQYRQQRPATLFPFDPFPNQPAPMIFIGLNSGKNVVNNNITGGTNTAIGSNALSALTTGSVNTAIGAFALASLTASNFNIGIGEVVAPRFVGGTGATGDDNIFIGNGNSLQKVNGRDNVIIGCNAAQDNITGDRNVMIGRNAGRTNANGSSNIFIGYDAGRNSTGSNQLFIDISNTSTPLIYGDFANDLLRFNGKVGVNVQPSTYQFDVNGTSRFSNTIQLDTVNSGITDTKILTLSPSNVVQYRNFSDFSGQTITISGGTGISTSGTYPNFTITNTAPDQIVSLSGGSNIQISGTYPNFTISSTGSTGSTQFDRFTTGFTYNNNTFTLTDNSGQTLSATINNVTGLTINGDLNVDYIDFNLTANPSHQEGRIHWNDDTKTLEVDTENNQVHIEVGHENVVRVVNKTGTQLLKGELVYINGAEGQRPTVTRADYTMDNTSARTLGFVAANINNNNNGYVITYGILRDVNTLAYSAGTAIYLFTGGTYNNIRPVAPKHEVRLGYILDQNATTGQIFVNVMNGYELTELHDVSATTVNNLDILQWNASADVWQPTSNPKFNSISATTISGGTFFGDGVNLQNVITGGTNLGSGIGVYTSTSNKNLQFKSITADSTNKITTTLVSDTIQLGINEQNLSIYPLVVQGNRLISGSVSYISGLTFSISPLQYIINGQIYNIPSFNTITLNSGDTTFDRVDVIYADISGNTGFIQGNPSSNPEKPSVDASTQIELTFVLVPANSAIPDVTNNVIYNENTGSPVEWNFSTNVPLIINGDATDDVYIGTKAISVVGATGNYTQRFTLSAASNFDTADFTTFQFALKNRFANASNTTIRIRFFDSTGAQNGSPVILPTDITYNTTNITNWQLISIPLWRFFFTSPIVRSVVFDFRTVGGGGANYSIDYIEFLQGFYTAPPTNAWTTIKGDASNTITAPTPNSLLTISGGTNIGSVIDNLTNSVILNLDNNISVNTISATTYVGLPTDIRITGATYSNNNFTFTNNTGGTFNVGFNTLTGLTINGNLNITGNTTAAGLTATTISASTYLGLPIDVRITGASYNDANTFTFTNNTGGTFGVGFNVMTGLTINGNLLINGNYTVTGDTIISGATIYSGDVTFNTNATVLGVLSGAYRSPYRAIGSAYTATTTDSTIEITGGTFTLSLPNLPSGRQLNIYNIGTGVVTVAGTGIGITIDGFSARTLAIRETLILQSTGNNRWMSIGRSPHTIQFAHEWTTGNAPQDATSYFIGNFMAQEPSTTSTATRRVIAQASGWITNMSVMVSVAGTLGTSDASTLTIRNRTTGLTSIITNVLRHNVASQLNQYSFTALQITKGDELELQWDTPTWSVNPQSVRHIMNTLVI